MANATQLGQTGLQGWREKVADGISQPVAKRAPLEEDQVRAIVGAAFFSLGGALRREDDLSGYAAGAPSLSPRLKKRL